MTELTEKEYDELDEAITANMPRLKTGAGGVFTRQCELLDALDSSHIISKMAHKELASA